MAFLIAFAFSSSTLPPLRSLETVETETPAETSQEDELEVDAPDPVQEGGVNESGTDDTAD